MERAVSRFLRRTRVAIKQREKRLVVGGNRVDLEDITKEAQLLRRFASNLSIIEFIDFFEDSNHYFLVMEEAGQSLFQFTIDCHKLIISDRLSLREWKRATKYLFAVMVQTLDWLHNEQYAANLDISLENVHSVIHSHETSRVPSLRAIY